MSESNVLLSMPQLDDESRELLNEVNELITNFIDENVSGSVGLNGKKNYSTNKSNACAGTRLSVDVAVSLVGLMMDVVQHYQNAEMHSNDSVSVLLYKENEIAAEVSHQQICRLLNLIARCTDVLLRTNMDQLLLMNVTRRVLSLLREAASANVACDEILEEEAKQILRDLHFEHNTTTNTTSTVNNNKVEAGSGEVDDEYELEESALVDKTTISSEKSPTSGSDHVKMKRVCFPRANSVDVLNYATSPRRYRKRSVEFMDSPHADHMSHHVPSTFSSPRRSVNKAANNDKYASFHGNLALYEERANSLNDFLAHSLSSSSLMWYGAYQRSGSVLANSEIPGQQLLKRVKSKHTSHKTQRSSSPDNDSTVSNNTSIHNNNNNNNSTVVFEETNEGEVHNKQDHPSTSTIDNNNNEKRQTLEEKEEKNNTRHYNNNHEQKQETEYKDEDNEDSVEDDNDDDDEDEIEFAVCLQSFYRDAFDKLQDFKEEIESIEDNLCAKAKKQLHSADTVMTLGCSEAVECFLLHAAQKDNKVFRVIILTPSLPSLSQHQQEHYEELEKELENEEILCNSYGSDITTTKCSAKRTFAQTLRFAQELQKSHIAVQVLPDSSTFAVMSMCTKVLLGAHAVLANGGMLASMGTHIVSIVASHFAIPVLVVTTTLQMSPYYPSDKECTRLIRLTRSDAQELPWATYGNPDEVLQLPYGTYVKANGESSSFIVHNPLMEYVPPELITLYATNETEFTPEQVYRVIRANYNDVD